jgi:hypothetical protein
MWNGHLSELGSDPLVPTGHVNTLFLEGRVTPWKGHSPALARLDLSAGQRWRWPGTGCERMGVCRVPEDREERGHGLESCGSLASR